MKIATIGIDLAKASVSVHGVDAHGKVMLRKTLSRAKLLELMAQLPRCLVGPLGPVGDRGVRTTRSGGARSGAPG